MNLRTTIILLVLLVGGGAALWFGPELASTAGITPKPQDPNGAGSPGILKDELTRERMRAVEIRSGGENIVLEKGAGGVWALPGKWPTRKAEADELVDKLTSLNSRFDVVPLPGENPDLLTFGLDRSQNPIQVTVKLDAGQHELLFGEPDAIESSAFARPTYVRVDSLPEVVRLGPDILPVLKRSREYYQRRQLFPQADRVKFTDSKPANPFSQMPEAASGPVEIPRAKSVTLEGPQGKVVLNYVAKEPPTANADHTPIRMDPLQLAEQWEIVEPVKDRADPDKLKALLSAIPNLWVEKFSPSDPAAVLAGALISSPGDAVEGLTSMFDAKVPADANKWALERAGLDKPEYKLSLTLTNGDILSLDVGKISHTSERTGVAPPPPRPGMPPTPPPIIREDYRYARLQGQPIIFEVKADKFLDLFPAGNMLRDEKLARFQTKDVQRVEIKQSGGTIILTKDKDEKKGDKWRVAQPIQALAELDKVNELIDKLGGLEARDKDVIDRANLKETGFEPANGIQISLAVEEEMPGPGESKKKRQRTIAFAFGKHDAKAKKVNVRVAGRERVNQVDESAIKLAERPALAYRGRRVLDFDAAGVARIDVKRASESFTLQQAENDWKLTAPVAAAADKSKANSLAEDLGRLEAVEYVNDAPKSEDLAKAGLDKPALTASVSFDDTAKPAQTLLIGKQRETKPEYFAKLASGGSIFVIKKELRDALDKSSLDYRPTQLWTLAPDDLVAFKIERDKDGFELKREGFNWKIVKPFEAATGPGQANPMVDAIAQLKLAGYQAHTAANPAEFGLDKPRLKIEFTAKEKDKEGKEITRTRSLLIGKAVPGKHEAFAKLADDSAVFRIPEATLLNTGKSALDLLDRQLLTLDSRRVNKIERGGAAKMTAVKEGAAWKIQAGAVSFPADKPTIDSMLRTWEFLQADKIAAYGANVKLAEFDLSPPADTITVTLSAGGDNKPETHVLKLGKVTDGGARFAQVDGNPAVAVISAVTARNLARDHLDFADKSLLNFDDADLRAIRRQMKNNDLEITHKDGWQVTKPVEQKGDETSLDDLAKQLAKLRADRVAAYAPPDLKPFGLDTPTATITIALEKDGKATTHVLKIGSPVDAKSPEGDRFVMIEGGKVVGVLSRSYAKKLLAEPIAFRDRTLIRRLPEPDKVTLERGERVGPNKAVFVKVDGTWKMTAPVAADAEHADLEDFLNALFKLRADEFVSEKPTPAKLKEFGLDKPESTWRFFSGDKEVLLLMIGKHDSTDQRVYARLGSGEMVFLLSPGVTNRATAEYRKRTLSSGLDAAQVGVLTLVGEQGAVVLRKDEGNWKVDGKPSAKINQTAVTELLATLANLKAERFVRDKDAPKALYGLEKPRRIIIAQTNMGMRQELDLGNIEGGSKRVYAAMPGKSEVVVLSEADTAKLDKDLQGLSEK